MAYGIQIFNASGNLVISSDSDGGVILNQETIATSNVTATAGGSVDVTVTDVSDTNKIAFGLYPSSQTSGITYSTSGNTLTISNAGAGDVIFDVNVFRLS
jgi:hypothetical protein